MCVCGGSIGFCTRYQQVLRSNYRYRTGLKKLVSLHPYFFFLQFIFAFLAFQHEALLSFCGVKGLFLLNRLPLQAVSCLLELDDTFKVCIFLSEVWNLQTLTSRLVWITCSLLNNCHPCRLILYWSFINRWYHMSAQYLNPKLWWDFSSKLWTWLRKQVQQLTEHLDPTRRNGAGQKCLEIYLWRPIPWEGWRAVVVVDYWVHHWQNWFKNQCHQRSFTTLNLAFLYFQLALL